MQVGSLISLEFHNKCIHRNFFVTALLKSPVMLALAAPAIEDRGVARIKIRIRTGYMTSVRIERPDQSKKSEVCKQ